MTVAAQTALTAVQLRDDFKMKVGPHLALRTFVGRVKRGNEDCGLVDEVTVGNVTYTIMIVCDGVSRSRRPHCASEVATNTAGDVLATQLRAGNSNLRSCLIAAVMAAQEAVAALADDSRDTTQKEELGPPKTTFLAAVAHGDQAELAWLGDCRAYLLLKRGGAKTLTKDHSWVNEEVDAGRMTFHQAMQSPDAHCITRCLGALSPEEAKIEPSFVSVDLSGAKMLILASDGFWNYGHPDQNQRPIPLLDQIHGLAPDADAAKVASQLVDFACACGGHDNITVAVLKPILRAQPTLSTTSNDVEKRHATD